jgi:hypothetical protein
MGGLYKMSYSRTYRESVSYSGSVSYSYPASQSGGSGSASFSGTIPVNITVNVNTEPFDGSVDRFNTSIGALGGSLSAMKLAQCAAIQQTTDEVSTALIDGFFNLINIELSQQLAALDSAIKAGFGLIVEQGKAVSDKKDVLEGDFNRITSRYIKIFTDLDNECYKRIHALDKKSFGLSEKVIKELISESTSNTAALNLLGIEEISSSKTIVFVSSLNRKALDVLKTIHDYISQESKIEQLVNSFLIKEIEEEIIEKVPLYVPVIWSESDMLESDTVDHNCFVPGFMDSSGTNSISETVDKYCRAANQSAWQKTDDAEKDNLNREFNAFAESNFSNNDNEQEQRVYKTMLSLWQNSDIFTLKRS